MQLVVLAAGHGTRFGGLKQLAPIGPNGEALMDYTAHAAATCGFSGAVVVVREEIRAEIQRHVEARWPAELPATFVCQPDVPGTAQAVAAAAALIAGPFAVANADDLYGEAALQLVLDHFTGPARPGTDPDAHLLVAYRLVQTILTDAEVKRGLCEQTSDGRLERVVEHRVRLREDGRFDATPIGRHAEHDGARRVLSGSERTSMNLWGFHNRMLELLESGLAAHADAPAGRELLLVDVVGDLVETGTDRVRVVDTDARCLGVTHREDLQIVREQLALDLRLEAAKAEVK